MVREMAKEIYNGPFYKRRRSKRYTTPPPYSYAPNFEFKYAVTILLFKPRCAIIIMVNADSVHQVLKTVT